MTTTRSPRERARERAKTRARERASMTNLRARAKARASTTTVTMTTTHLSEQAKATAKIRARARARGTTITTPGRSWAQSAPPRWLWNAKTALTKVVSTTRRSVLTLTTYIYSAPRSNVWTLTEVQCVGRFSAIRSSFFLGFPSSEEVLDTTAIYVL